jgi:hypothetical protein
MIAQPPVLLQTVQVQPGQFHTEHLFTFFAICTVSHGWERQPSPDENGSPGNNASTNDSAAPIHNFNRESDLH